VNASPPPTQPNPVVRLIRWFWHSYLVLFGLGVLFVFGMFLSDGAWWVVFPFAFFGWAAYVQIRNRRRR
jgi:hypothetical protein